jgi:hypothetical protein
VYEKVIDNVAGGLCTENVPVDVTSIIQVPFVDLTNVELFQDVVDFLFLVDDKHFPIWIDAATTCA